MIKVCFIYDSWTNDKTLDVYRKMTPSCSGKWKDIEAVTSIEEADWCVVIDDTIRKVNSDKTLYISAHPYIKGYTGYKDLSKKIHKLDAKHTFGFGEWWLKYDYDYLSNLKLMNKPKKTCCIMSNSSGEYGRTRRKEFAVILDKLGVDVYGRIQGIGKGALGNMQEYWYGKEKVLEEYKFSVEVDVGKTKNYFSERVFDSLLMWCLPLYWGSDNLEEFLPKGSFRYIDIYGNGEELKDLQEPDYEAIAEARELLLNKYQLWARVYQYIHSRT